MATETHPMTQDINGNWLTGDACNCCGKVQPTKTMHVKMGLAMMPAYCVKCLAHTSHCDGTPPNFIES